MRRLLAVFISLFAASRVVAETAAAPARIDAAPPVQLTRTLRTFDFEERARGNIEDTPAGWVKVEGPGLPRYISGKLDTRSPAVSGTGTFRFDLDGGSVVYRFPGTRTPVMPHARYRISTMVRTTPLRVARAQLTAYFCDSAGKPIVSSLRRSSPIVSEAGGEPTFKPVNIELVAEDPDAASLVVELGLLQPALRDDVQDAAAKLAEDIHGSAWFDDVRIAQVPDFTLRTDRPLNVFGRDEQANLRVRLSDRLTSDLTAEIRVVDATGQLVFQRTGPLAFADGDRGGAGRPRVGSVSLPPLPPGWYQARLTLRTQGQFVDERSLDFVRLTDTLQPQKADPRIGLIATDVPPEAWPLVSGMMDTLGAGRVKLPVWSHEFSVDGDAGVAAGNFDRLLDELAERDQSITACLAAPPPDVESKLAEGKTGAWTDLLAAPKEQWQPQLAFLLARRAGPHTAWQFGDDSMAATFSREPTYRKAFERVEGEYQPLVGTADLAMPWSALFEIGNQPLPQSVSLTVPGAILPEQIPLYLSDFTAGTPKRDVAVALEPIDRNRYGRDVQRADLALRVAYAFAGGASRVDLPVPMRITVDDQHIDAPIAEPDELLITQRVICTQLANARYSGTIRIAPGVEAFVFDRDGVGIMLLRAKSADAPPNVVLTLGGRATLVNLDGTSRPLAAASQSDRDAFVLPISQQPVFITGVDAALLRLRTSVAIDNPLLESTVGQHTRTLMFTNTFDCPISGSIRLTGPNGWTLSLPTMNFSLNPGETYRGPLTLTLPATTSAGERTLIADLRVDAYGNARHVAVPLALRVGLSDVGLQSYAVRDGNDLVVQQTITNYGSRPINYTCFAVLPGQARQERIVTNLAPGRSTIRKFRFPAPGPEVTRVRSGVREMNGQRMLNQDIELIGQ